MNTPLIERIIETSARNNFLVFLLALFAVAAGLSGLWRTPLDAIPDLSDVQVIIYTDWEGRSPDLVEDQITYPISSQFIAAPKVKFVRGESMFGKSFVYVIFEDGTDIYWARSRVIEYFNSVRGSAARGVNPSSARTPPAWAGSLNTRWWTKAEGTIWPNCAPSRTGICATPWNRSRAWPRSRSVGGFVKEYQVDLDPNKLLAYGIPSPTSSTKSANPTATSGGKIFEVGFDGVLHPRARLHQKRGRHREHPAQNGQRHAGLTSGMSARCISARTFGAASRS